MNKVILLALFVPVMAQGQIIEDFESGFSENWVQGRAGHWMIDTTESINGSFSLHHVFDNDLSGSDCIGIPLANLHPDEGSIRWSFLIRHGYDPSGSNNWAVYLMSDTDPATFSDGAALNGFAVGVNLKGYDDTLKIWKIKGSSASVVATCPLNWQNDIGAEDACMLCIERTIIGEWSIAVYDSVGILKWIAEATDTELFNASWLLLNYRYSSTRDRLLWFDDLKVQGVFYEDTIPPEITCCKVTGMKSLEITFNEELNDDILLAENIIPEDTGNQITVIDRIAGAIYRLQFSARFNNKVLNSLIINNLCDKSGNCTNNIRVDFTPVWAEAGDVLFSEIMADPLPSVGLPEREYLEITNRTQYTYDLEDWIYGNEDQTVQLPACVIEPGEFFILCSVSDTLLFQEYGKTIGLRPFPVLTDYGKMIVLSDSLGNLIHGIEYSSDWYGDILKESGGWSLEIIDTDFPFYTEGNWEDSSSPKGGTPGCENSASRTNPDDSFSGLLNVFPEDSTSVDIWLSETVIGLDDNIHKITIDIDPVTSISPLDPLYRRFRIKTTDPLVPEQVYILHLSPDIVDFSGNPIIDDSYSFGMPVRTESGDIVFNELLFDPCPDDPDYIELYNISNRIFDVSRLYLVSINESGDTSAIRPVSDQKRCFIPGTFYTVTTDRGRVLNRYFTSDGKYIFNISSLPSMPDNRGHLLLLNRELDIIDEVRYSDEMHYSLLADNEGISLEKIRPQSASGDRMNWHSAAESAGWGTPGKENSVFSRMLETDDRVILSSGRITPDNDGYEDLLVIDLNLEGFGNVVTVTIFDETGNYVQRIAENLFAGNRATIIWDGTAEDGNIVNTGIYILLIELYNDQGKTKSWKKVCTVIRN